jgi:hypothetical protein
VLRDLSQLDAFALDYAKQLAARQPRCDQTIAQAPVLAIPQLTDTIPVYHTADGIGYQLPLVTLGELIGGGGSTTIAYNTAFSGAGLTLYNYGSYTGTSSGSAGANTTALTNMFAAMALPSPGLVGGFAWIPQYGYQINASNTGIQLPDSSVIQGLGSGGRNNINSIQFIINGTGGLVLFNASGQHSSGGIYLHNLGFNWANSTSNLDTCIYVQSGWNVRAVHCNFYNCPTAFNSAGLGSGLESPTIQYKAGSPNNSVAVILQQPQSFCVGPGGIISQDGVNPSSGNGPTNCAAVMVCGGQSNGEHLVVRDLHLSEWSYGVCFNTSQGWGASFSTSGINSGSHEVQITNCQMQNFITSLFIQPAGSTGQINSVAISNCTMNKSQNSTDGHPLVYIDTNGGVSTNVAEIDFVACNIYGNITSGTSGGNTNYGVASNNQYGVQINVAQNVRFTGGGIGNFGNNANLGADGSANVCISGGCNKVSFCNVHLDATYPNAGGGSTGNGATQYAVLWSSTALGGLITFDGCSMQGFTNPIGVTGTVTVGGLYVRNCLGYNDQNTTINTLANITVSTAYQAYTQSANGGKSYYGPSFVMFTANASGGTFAVNAGAQQTLLANQVVCLTLTSPYDSIEFFTHAPAAFQWIGK